MLSRYIIALVMAYILLAVPYGTRLACLLKACLWHAHTVPTYLSIIPSVCCVIHRYVLPMPFRLDYSLTVRFVGVIGMYASTMCNERHAKNRARNTLILV